MEMKESIEQTIDYLIQLIEQIPDEWLIEQLVPIMNALHSMYENDVEEKHWPDILYKVGVTLAQLPVGDHRLNKELAIVYFYAGLRFWNRQDHPESWAITMHALGHAYNIRIEGDRLVNQEKAIEYFTQALKEYRRDVMPLQWAMIIYALGNAYHDRIEGDLRVNREKAIECYTQALKECRRDVVPLDWAITMYALGNVYIDRLEGERRVNLEKAIDYFTQALKEHRRDVEPLQWAATMLALGKAHHDRLEGDLRVNQEKAIEYFTQALKEYRRDVVPLQWAATMHAIGKAYNVRIEGDCLVNQEKAIEYFTQALKEYRRDVMPLQWAMIIYALGFAYGDRIEGESRANLEKAIDYFTQALKECRRDVVPLQWAATMLALGRAHHDRLEGDLRVNQEKAIEYFTQALKEYRRDVVPLQWAATMLAIGHAYNARIEGDRRVNLEKAIEYFTQALKEYRRDVVPLDWAMTINALGSVHLGQGNIDEALKFYTEASEVIDSNAPHALFIHFNSGYGYSQLSCGRRDEEPTIKTAGIERLQASIKAIEQTRSSIIGQASRKEFLAKHLGPYSALIEHYLVEGNYDDAWHWMERSRSRVLLESVDLSALKPFIPEAAEKAKNYWELSKKINRLRAQLMQEEQQTATLDSPAGLRQAHPASTAERSISTRTRVELDNLEEQRQEVFKSLAALDPTYAGLASGAPVDHAQLHGFLDAQKAATASFFVQSDTIHCLVSYTQNGSVQHRHIKLPDADLRVPWEKWMVAYWSVDKEDQERQYRLLDELLAATGKLMEPVYHLLKENGIARLFVSPHGYLHLIPLHAAIINGSGGYLLQTISVSYTPSVTLTTRAARSDHKKASPQEVIGVFAAPEGASYLHFGEQEIDMLSGIYEKANVTQFKHIDATLENIVKGLSKTNGIIGQLALSCHGHNDSEDPSQSSLFLSNGETADAPHNCKGRPVNAQELLSKLSGTNIKLAILSACETGQSLGFIEGNEEYVGLDSVFMQMSVSGIVSSLYSINDWSTSEVMRRFHTAVAAGTAPSLALQNAQNAFIKEKLEPSEEAKNIYRMEVGKSATVDYSHPYYWAFLKYSGVFE